MPNKPKTPNRTFRLDDAFMKKLGELRATLGCTNLTDTLRYVVTELHNDSKLPRKSKKFAKRH